MRFSCAKTKRARSRLSTRIRSSKMPSTVRRWASSRRHSVSNWISTRTMSIARGAFLNNQATIKPSISRSEIPPINTRLKTTLWRSWSRTRTIRALIGASWITTSDTIIELSKSQWKVRVIIIAVLIIF